MLEMKGIVPVTDRKRPGAAVPPPLFVYGTLTDPLFMGRLLEREVVEEPATLVEYRRLELASLGHAVVVPEAGGEVEGLLYRGLTEADYERLDAYEGVAEGLYRRQAAEARTARRDREAVVVYVPTERTRRRHR